jgi:hypothetical protein
MRKVCQMLRCVMSVKTGGGGGFLRRISLLSYQRELRVKGGGGGGDSYGGGREYKGSWRVISAQK